jgi:hypothetical protein
VLAVILMPRFALLIPILLLLTGCFGVSGGKFYGGVPGVAYIDRGGHFTTDPSAVGRSW